MTLTETAVLPEIWDISLSPDLDWLRPILNTCAQAEDNMGLVEANLSSTGTNNQPVDFWFQLGDTSSNGAPLFDMGFEPLAVIVHPDNPLTQLSWQELVEIQTGEITNWQDTANGQLEGFSKSITVFRYTENSGIQQFLDSKLTKDFAINFSALLAPGPFELITGLRLEDGGIGILPERLVDKSVKPLEISGIEEQDLAVPIVVKTKTEPEGSALNFLVCVQNKTK